jgi:hypothetical protein
MPDRVAGSSGLPPPETTLETMGGAETMLGPSPFFWTVSFFFWQSGQLPQRHLRWTLGPDALDTAGLFAGVTAAAL